MREDIRNERMTLLTEINQLEQKCEGCEIHYELNKMKNITALERACRACPIGQQVGQYGEKLLTLTKKSRGIITD